MLLSPLLSLMFFWAAEQDTKAGPDVRSIPPCAQTKCRGKRVAHGWNVFQFCIPRGLKYKRVAGFEGDLHDRVTVRLHGELSELIIFTANATWGPTKEAPSDWPSAEPGQDNQVSVQHWQCDGDWRDFKLQRNGRNWRLLTFIKGFAEYKDVPSSAAQRFDRVLDSLCCKPIPRN